MRPRPIGLVQLSGEFQRDLFALRLTATQTSAGDIAMDGAHRHATLPKTRRQFLGDRN